MDEKRMKVRMRGSSSALGPWIWYCPCCLNSPGASGFPTVGAAYDEAVRHAEGNHVDWDNIDWGAS